MECPGKLWDFRLIENKFDSFLWPRMKRGRRWSIRGRTLKSYGGAGTAFSTRRWNGSSAYMYNRNRKTGSWSLSSWPDFRVYANITFDSRIRKPSHVHIYTHNHNPVPLLIPTQTKIVETLARIRNFISSLHRLRHKILCVPLSH